MAIFFQMNKRFYIKNKKSEYNKC